MDNKILIHSANSPDVYHWGIHGQQWGKRRYQNEDGSLTPLGRIHYGVGQAKEASKIKIREMKAETRNAVKLAKAQAKTANEVAKAEAKKLESEAKAYRDRKEADKMVELERIKTDREADRNAARLEEKRINNEDKLNRDLAETSKEQVESEKSTSNALKVVGGVLAAAGIGYLLYRAVKGSTVTSEGNIEAGKNAINNVSNKPANSFFNTANETQRQKDLIGKAIKDKNAAEASFIKSQAKQASNEAKRQKDLIKQAVKASNRAKANEAKAAAKELKRQQNLIKKTVNFENNSKKSWYIDPKLGNKFHVTTEGRGSRLANWLYGPITSRSEKAQKTLDALDSWKKRRLYMSDDNGMILIHSATAGRDVCHYGVKGQKWGVITKKEEDFPSHGRTKNITGEVQGTNRTGSIGSTKVNNGNSKNNGFATYTFTQAEAEDEIARAGAYAILSGNMTVDEANKFLNTQAEKYANGDSTAYAMFRDLKTLSGKNYLDFNQNVIKKINAILQAASNDPNIKKNIMEYGKKASINFGKKAEAEQTKKSTMLSTIKPEIKEAAKSKKTKKSTMLSTIKPKIKEAAKSKKTNKYRVKHSDAQDFYLNHSEYGEDVEHWGIKGQKWGVRRWQYEDGSLTPEGRIHYGRISEKGQQQGKMTGKVARDNTAEFNRLNKQMSKAAEKYSKTGKRKYAEAALQKAELMNDENYVKNVGRLASNGRNAQIIAGLPGVLVYDLVNSSSFKEQQKAFNEAKAKFQNMSLDELDKAFNETIGKTEKVKFNAKEMDKETKAKEDAVFKESKEYREIGGQYKNEKEARKAYDEHKKVAQKSEENQNESKKKKTYDLDFQEWVQNDERNEDPKWMDKQYKEYKKDPEGWLSKYDQEQENKTIKNLPQLFKNNTNENTREKLLASYENKLKENDPNTEKAYKQIFQIKGQEFKNSNPKQYAEELAEWKQNYSPADIKRMGYTSYEEALYDEIGRRSYGY